MLYPNSHRKGRSCLAVFPNQKPISFWMVTSVIAMQPMEVDVDTQQPNELAASIESAEAGSSCWLRTLDRQNIDRPASMSCPGSSLPRSCRHVAGDGRSPRSCTGRAQELARGRLGSWLGKKPLQLWGAVIRVRWLAGPAWRQRQGSKLRIYSEVRHRNGLPCCRWMEKGATGGSGSCSSNNRCATSWP